MEENVLFSVENTFPSKSHKLSYHVKINVESKKSWKNTCIHIYSTQFNRRIPIRETHRAIVFLQMKILRKFRTAIGEQRDVVR